MLGCLAILVTVAVLGRFYDDVALRSSCAVWVFSCVCAGMVPVAPAVGAVLVCACGPGGRRCGLMCVWYLR